MSVLRVTCKMRLKGFKAPPCEEKGQWLGVEGVMRGMGPQEVDKEILIYTLGQPPNEQLKLEGSRKRRFIKEGDFQKPRNLV